MWRLVSRISKKKRSPKETGRRNTVQREHPFGARHILYLCLVAVGALFIAIGVRELILGEQEDIAARNEYQQLRENFIETTSPPSPIPTRTVLRSDELSPLLLYDGDDEHEDEAELVAFLSLNELKRLNSDFIGWLSIKDIIEYPVVRANDNWKYIRTTFSGQSNNAGAIFMDYRNRSNFDEQVCIIYGHHTRDGTMFAPLANYLDPDYLKRNPDITIMTPDGKYLSYKIFAAKVTDAWDSVYSINASNSTRLIDTFPDVPENAERFMLLSTCTRSSDPDERILVYAATTVSHG